MKLTQNKPTQPTWLHKKIFHDYILNIYLNYKRRTKSQFFVQMQKKLFHSRVTFNKHTFRYIHHLLKLVRVQHLLGVVGRNEVVQHDEQEEADAH